MKQDVIVIGAGIGGLTCAAFLANAGRRVLVLEKSPHIGGTSYIFGRRGFGFPMGPLSFGFPERVRGFLDEAGVKTAVRFRRNHFALAAAGWNIVFSRPLAELRRDFGRDFPDEAAGLDAFFAELDEAAALAEGIDGWHPDYRLAAVREGAPAEGSPPGRLARARELARTPCAARLRRHLRDERLVRLLGSQGMAEPEMSMLGLGFMWNVMSQAGIWFPDCGLHGLNDLLADRVAAAGGEIRLATTVDAIIVRKGRAVGARTGSAVHEADWIVANADAKTALLGLLEPGVLPGDFREAVAATPYTGSELRVYLGVDPGRVDLGRLPATRVGFRAIEPPPGPATMDIDDLARREIDICLWSENAPGLVPEGRAALVLGAGFPYDQFARFRSGYRKRTSDYAAYKGELARRLIRAAEGLLPGLASAVEVMEAATPLTYEDWGHRHRGAIAGWTWSSAYENALGRKLLIETPVPRLLLAGIFAASELFLGGVPTSMLTARLAADRILGER